MSNYIFNQIGAYDLSQLINTEAPEDQGDLIALLSRIQALPDTAVQLKTEAETIKNIKKEHGIQIDTDNYDKDGIIIRALIKSPDAKQLTEALLDLTQNNQALTDKQRVSFGSKVENIKEEIREELKETLDIIKDKLCEHFGAVCLDSKINREDDLLLTQKIEQASLHLKHLSERQQNADLRITNTDLFHAEIKNILENAKIHPFQADTITQTRINTVIDATLKDVFAKTNAPYNQEETIQLKVFLPPIEELQRELG